MKIASRTYLFLFVFLTYFTLGIGSCKEKKILYLDEHAQEMVITDFSEDIKIPTKLWDVLEGKEVEPLKSENGHKEASHKAKDDHGKSDDHKKTDEHAPKEGGDGHGAPAPDILSGGAKSTIFAPITLYLKEKNPKVLKEPAYVITYPRGGGFVDLSNIVNDEKQGSFYMGFKYGEEGMTDFKVYFVSQARKRRVDGRILGGGCDRFYDITGFISSAISGNGVLINTTKLRHLSVLGGHMVFSYIKDSSRYVSQITFYDSTRPDFFCEALRKKKEEAL